MKDKNQLVGWLLITLVFCGWMGGTTRLDGDMSMSRVHRQTDRVHHSGGIHPAISTDGLGRHYITEWNEN